MRYRNSGQTCAVTTRVGGLSPKLMPRGLCKPSITHVSAALDWHANSVKPRPEAATGCGRALTSPKAPLDEMKRADTTKRLEMRGEMAKRGVLIASFPGRMPMCV